MCDSVTACPYAAAVIRLRIEDELQCNVHEVAKAREGDLGIPQRALRMEASVRSVASS